MVEITIELFSCLFTQKLILSATMKKDMQKLIDKLGSKQAAAEKLMISLRYVDMILAGKQPSKRLVQLIKIHISMG